MSHKLSRLTSSLYNTPLLIEENAFKGVLAYLKERNAGEVKAGMDGEDFRKAERFIYNEDTRTGVIELIGPTTAKPITMMGFDCGGANYLQLKQDFESLIEMGAKTIAMMVDSPGGDAYSMSDSANYIRNLLDENDVKLISFVEGMSASAGYGMACISDEIVGSWDSEVGSIGCLVQLINSSKALEKEGYERTYVTAGASKVPYAADGSFRPEFVQDIQDKVDICYKNFTEHVAKHRNMKVEDVIATEAKMFYAADAVKLGLMDKVMTSEEFFTYLAVQAQSNTEVNMSVKDRIFKFAKTNDEGKPTMNVEELQAQLATAQEQVASMPALTSQLATLTASLQEKESAMQALAAKLEGLETAKAEAAVAQRKATLSAVLPADKVEESMSMYAGLDDATFSFVTSQLQATKDALAASGLMAEVGGEGVEQEAKAPEAGSQEDILAKGIAAAKSLRK